MVLTDGPKGCFGGPGSGSGGLGSGSDGPGHGSSDPGDGSGARGGGSGPGAAELQNLFAGTPALHAIRLILDSWMTEEKENGAGRVALVADTNPAFLNGVVRRALCAVKLTRLAVAEIVVRHTGCGTYLGRLHS